MKIFEHEVSVISIKVGQFRSHFSPQDSYGWGSSACLTFTLYQTHFLPLPSRCWFEAESASQKLTCSTEWVKEEVETTKLRGQLDVGLKEMKESQRTPRIQVGAGLNMVKPTHMDYIKR